MLLNSDNALTLASKCFPLLPLLMKITGYYFGLCTMYQQEQVYHGLGLVALVDIMWSVEFVLCIVCVMEKNRCVVCRRVILLEAWL